MFFWNTHNTYLTGLDPTYMSLYDPELFNLWRRVSSGQVAAPSTTIRETFGAEYVFSDVRHTSFLRVAASDPAIEEVARNSNAVVLRIRDGTR